MLSTWQPNGSINDKSRLSFLVGYIFGEKKLKYFFNIINTYDFTTLTPIKIKNLSEITKKHKNYNPSIRGLDDFYSSTKRRTVVLPRDSNIAVSRFTGRIQRFFVPRFYHDRRNTNFLRLFLTFVGEKKEIDEIGFFDAKFGRKLYEYSRKGDQNTRNIHPKKLDCPFLDKYYSSIGFTVHGFSFTFKNTKPINQPNKY